MKIVLLGAPDPEKALRRSLSVKNTDFRISAAGIFSVIT